MSVDHRRVIQSGVFEFDTATGDVRKRGRPLALQAQPREVLKRLVIRAGQLVTREELQKALWGDATYVDFDNGLNVAVRKIRDALGDSSGNPRFIETVPRQGYRFIAKPAPLPEKRVEKTRWLFAASIGALAIAGVLMAWRSYAARGQPGAARLESVAVLPFANLIGEADREYLAHGLTDTLITELAAAGVPRVISRQSTIRYRDTAKNVAVIAHELGVQAVVQGSIVGNGGRYVVNVQLIDARSDQHLWAGRFERIGLNALTDSADIVSHLVREMGFAETKITRRAPVRPEARDAYLRGVFFWHKRSGDSLKRALELFTAATRVQPDYAPAWAGLANVYAIGSPNIATLGLPETEVNSRGIAAAQEAMRLDPTAGEPHAALGRILMAQWRWQEAERELRRAVELSPQFATGYQWYGTLLMRLGRCDEALQLVTTGSQLDPLAPIVNDAIGSVNLACNEPERAVEVRRAIVELHPDNAQVRYGLSKAYTVTGRYESAISEAREALRLDPENCYFQTSGLAWALGRASRHTEAKELARAFERSTRFDSARPVCLAALSAALGAPDRMFESLERAYSERSMYLDLLLVEHWIDPYRRDPRYLRLLERIGIVHDERSRHAALNGPRFGLANATGPPR